MLASTTGHAVPFETKHLRTQLGPNGYGVCARARVCVNVYVYVYVYVCVCVCVCVRVRVTVCVFRQDRKTLLEWLRLR